MLYKAIPNGENIDVMFAEFQLVLSIVITHGLRYPITHYENSYYA